jgi:hypothetical protein
MRIKSEGAFRTKGYFVNFACDGDYEVDAFAIEDLGVRGVDVRDGGIAFP